VEFEVTRGPVNSTQLFVVYAAGHALPERYTASTGTLGFRVPATFPDAGPEDSFFLQPADLKLKLVDPSRNSCDVHRAGVNGDLLVGTELTGSVLVFSWHLWNKVPWDRRRHTLVDHYRHCLRRFDEPEHDQ
jgi:hypothetical protein